MSCERNKSKICSRVFDRQIASTDFEMARLKVPKPLSDSFGYTNRQKKQTLLTQKLTNLLPGGTRVFRLSQIFKLPTTLSTSSIVRFYLNSFLVSLLRSQPYCFLMAPSKKQLKEIQRTQMQQLTNIRLPSTR
jgi:hypothetical protein